MKAKLILLLALVIGGLAGSWIKNLPGFVIIAVDRTSYEMRLWIAVCLILGAFGVLALLVVFIRTFFASAGKVKKWRGGRHWQRSRKKSIEGMLAFSEGRWKAAEDAMIGAAKNSDTTLINYLIAAQAAQQQSAEVRRDAYLRSAFKAEPSARTAIGLTQAQLQLQHGQFEHALATLAELRSKNPHHPYVLKLLCQLFTQLQDWQKLLELLPSLKKFEVIENDALLLLEEKAVAGVLRKRANDGEVEALTDCWLNLPSASRKQPKNILEYARLLIDFSQMDTAETLLRPNIKKTATSENIRLYGQIVTQDPAKQLSFLESFQQSNENPPVDVFLALGKLAYNAKLWGKSRHFLEQALRLAPSAEGYLFMAKTLEQLGDVEHAEKCYQQGLEFATNPHSHQKMLSLAKGSEDLVTAELLPKFQKLEN